MRLEIHPIDAEAFFKSENPFEIVHQAPQEIAANRHALGGGALQLRQVVAQVHDAIEVVDLAVGGEFVGGGGSVLADVDVIDVPDFRRQPRHPVNGLGPDPEPLGIHVRERSRERQHGKPRLAVGCDHVELRRIDVQADEVARRADDLQFVGGEFRRGGAREFEEPVGVFALQDHAEKARIQFARGNLGSADIFRRIDRRQTGRDVIGGADPATCAPFGADRLHRKAVPQGDVVTDLVQFRRRQIEPGGVDVPSIAKIHEPSGFVDREEIPDAVAQALRHVTCVISKRLRGVAGLPSADAVLQDLRQIPVIQRGKGLEAIGQQLIHQPIVEVEAFRVRRTRALRKHPRPRDRKSIRLDAEIPDQADVLLVAVVVVVGAVAVGVIGDPAGGVGKGVPDRAAAAVFIDGALDLIGRRGRAPQKSVRETGGGVAVGRGLGLAGGRHRRRCRHAERGQAGKPGKIPARELTEHDLSRFWLIRIRLPAEARSDPRA